MEAFHHGNPRKRRRTWLSYENHRWLPVRNVKRADGSFTTRKVSCGVPQGSVLGPDLWNVLYDGILRKQFPADVEFIAFADEITLIATTLVTYVLKDRLEEALGAVVSWTANNGLELAIEKTEAIVLTNKNVQNTMSVKFGAHSFQSNRSVRYLGVHRYTTSFLASSR